MTNESDQTSMPELPSTERGPREPQDQEYTGVGTSRSAEEAFSRAGGIDNSGINDDVDPAITVGATTSSHGASADGININRSGSGGTGGPGNDEDETGTTPAAGGSEV
jgi:hypothetical protein